jgi:2-hydroxycyclohexanecarboxyl-CoA dehydrogenase
MFDLSGKVAVVTGGGQGLGRGIALALAGQGADVALVDIKEETANQVKAEIEAMGRKAIVCKVDVGNLEECQKMAETVVNTFGKISILINDAAVDRIEPFTQNTVDWWNKVIGVNLVGTINCSRVVLDNMITNKSGRIINISSDAGRVGSTGEAVYAATKAGVIGLAKTLAREHARDQITVNTICPGPSDTPMFATTAESNPKLAQALAKIIPLGRLGKPEDVAAAVVYLASEEAEFVTGQVLSVSGGLTMNG